MNNGPGMNTDDRGVTRQTDENMQAGRKTTEQYREAAAACALYGIPGIGSGSILALRRVWCERTGGDPAVFASEILKMTDREAQALAKEAFPAETEGSADGAAGRAAGRMPDAATAECAAETNAGVPAGISAETWMPVRRRISRREAFLAGRKAADPGKALETLEKRGISFTFQGDPAFPDKLSEIPNAPYALYYIGKLPGTMPTCAVVGARMASSYGRGEARRFAERLSAAGIGIISGMARGVDGIAGRGALEAGGYSLAVLGSGVDVPYPTENTDLYERLCENGCVVSEYPPGTAAQSRLFPARNRIISALSDLVLVIEAKLRSGSLITVDFALEQGRDVYALPGRVTDPLAAGCNRLIRTGAGIATSPDDLIEALLGVRTREEDDRSQGNAFRSQSLQEPERSLYLAFDGKDIMSRGALAEAAERRLGCSISGADLSRCILQLVFKGYITEVSAGMFERN